ncbi:phage tail protein (plasmid) [Clostridium perfringens]
MLQLHDKNKRKIAGLINYENLCIESVLSTGYKTLSFSYPKNSKHYDEIIEEGFIRTKENEFVIKSRDICGDYTKFECILNLDELEGNIFDRFESVEQTITAALNLAIVGTGWTVKDNTLKKKRTVRCVNKSSLEIVQEIKRTYRVDIVFNTLEKQIEIHEHLGQDKGAYFIDSLNLTALQVQSDSYKFATRIIAEGKDGLTFSSINNGKNYVENYQYSRKIKTIYWKDERYTIKESLLEDAKAKLEEISKPFVSYNASILNLAELNPKYKNILDYQLGDTITLISRNNKVKDKQRIVKTVEYPQDHSRDTVELANATLKFEDIQQENQETTDTVNNITTDNGTVDGSTIDSIQVKQIEDFKANVIQVTNLHALNADIDYLKVNKADMQDVNIVKAKIGTLETTKASITELTALKSKLEQAIIMKADITDLNAANGKIAILESKTASIDNLLSQKASINDLNALNATISEALIKKATIAQLEALETKTNNLIADKANIKDLNVINANINSLKTYTADIKTLLNGNLSSENIQTKGITSDKLVIANGFIKDAMIDSINVNKLNAGVLTTDKFNIRSRDGNLIIKDNTIQIKDSSKVRVQVGKDDSGDYSLYVWDKLGNLMFNALGITKDAIKDKIIRNDMVSDDAAIEGKKLNIESVIREVNNGKSNLKASKIDIDTKGQTLDIAFSNLVTENGKNKEEIVSLITKLNVQQGQINASIENSKVLEGKQKNLEDNYNRTVVTVDSLKNTVGQQKILIDSATGKITSVEVKANTLEKNLSGLTQTVTDTKKVIENNKTVLESKNAELKANIDKISSSLSSVSSTVDKNNKTLVVKTNTLEQNLSGLIQTVANNKTVIDGKITSVEGETHELKASLGGLTSKLDTLKSTTDGINKTVSNQGSVINQLKDSINLKVDSSTFTQSTTTINNNINKAKEEAINTANRNTNNAINNIKIGGRNYGLNTNVMQQDPYNITFSKDLVFEKGKTYTISMDFDVENLVKGSQERVGCEGSILFTDGTRQYIGLWHWIKEGTTFKGRKSYTFTIENKDIKENMTGIHIYTELVGSGKRNLGRFKIEEGNKATDYTIAPEDLQSYANDVAKAKADLAQANAIANADGKITEEERKRIQQAEANLNVAIARADKAKADAKVYSDTLGQQLKANAEKYANDVAIAKSELAKEQSKAYADGIVTEEEKTRIAEAKKNLDTAIAKATEAETKAKSYADSKKQEAIKAAENLALEKSNLAKKYADEVATAKANLAKTEAIANADGKISAEEQKRIQQAQENLNTAISKADKAKQDAINEANRVAELKKQEAINSANSHADNKANEALNNAKAFVNAEITTVNSHLNKATSEINVLKEKIESKVSQSDIDKSIQEIKIGGRNLALNSSRFELPARNTGTASDNYNYISIDANLLLNSEYTISANVEIVSGSIKEISIYDYPGGKCSRVPIINNRITYTFTKRSNTVNSVLLYAGLAGETRGNSVIFTNVMLEKGNMVSDWSPAPEDTDKLIIDNIKTVTDKITTVESKFTQENNSIKASVQDLNSTTQTITTNVSNINRDLTSKINSNLDAAKNFATDIAIAKANLAKEQAIANADGKITAEEQKRIQQAQANLNTAIAKATEAETKAKSYADIKKQEAINSANNNTNNAINNIKIGGRNYGLNTNVMQQDPYNITFSKDLVFEKGKTYTISMDFDVENLVKGSQERVGCEGSILFTDGTRQYIGLWHWIKEGTTFKGRKSYTFTIENKDIKENMTGIHIYTELVGSGKRNLGRFKIEEGNKATDYTIAPEDLQSYANDVAKAKADLAQANAIANADGKITEEERKRIQQAEANLNVAIARADKAKADAKVYSDTLGQQLKANAEKYANDVAIAKSELAKEQSKAYADGIVTEEEKNRIAEAKKNLDTAIAKATEAETKAKSYADSKKQEAIKAAENLALEKSNLAKKYADDVAKAKADLAQANAIANADGKITAEEKKRIQQAQENLNTAISKADKAKQDAINEANRVAELKKQEAINSANSHADSKANEALNNAKAYTNTEITTINNKVHNVESNLNILSNEIKSKVSQSDIDKSIQEIKIGGRNLVLNSDVYINENGDIQFNFSDINEWRNKYITISLDIDLVNVVGSRVGFEPAIAYEDGEVQYLGYWIWLNTPKTMKERVSCTHKIKDKPIKGLVQRGIYIQGVTSGKVKIGRPKLEFGTKATAWTPAPEDINKLVVDSLKVVDTKISDVSSSVTQLRDSVTTDIRAINSKTQSIETTLNGKASKQEVTEVNNRVATIKASLDSITQRVSNTESKTNSLETNINGKASKQELTVVNNKVTEVTASLNGITQRVGNTESRINTLDVKIAGAVTLQQFTEFKQSNDKFKFTVEQRSSVSNILPNSSFHGGDRGWLHTGNEFWSGAYSGYGFKGRITGAIKNRTSYNNPERYLQTHKAYKVKKNTTYTINFHYICEKNVQSMDAFVVLSDTEHGDYAQPICILTAQGGSQSNAAEEKPFTYKFNTGNHEWVWIRFDHNGMKSGVNWDECCWVYISEVGIYEGDVGAVKWTPKGGEVYSANYQMDGLGFKGTFEDGTYAYLGKEGLEWYNAGTGHAYHALTYVTSFDIPIGNPGKAYIKLPAEFTKRRSSLKWTVALRGYYYSTDGDFFPFHIHCTGGRDYIENGLVVCEVQGYCKIQNAQNAGDVQFRPLTAMLIAIA